jgi:spore coat protein CotF
MAFSARDAIDEMLKRQSIHNRYVLLDALTDLVRENYLISHVMNPPKYQWGKSLPRQKIKRKFKFCAASNI